MLNGTVLNVTVLNVTVLTGTLILGWRRPMDATVGADYLARIGVLTRFYRLCTAGNFQVLRVLTGDCPVRVGGRLRVDS